MQDDTFVKKEKEINDIRPLSRPNIRSENDTVICIELSTCSSRPGEVEKQSYQEGGDF